MKETFEIQILSEVGFIGHICYCSLLISVCALVALDALGTLDETCA
jgi:hypothetical protein